MTQEDDLPAWRQFFSFRAPLLLLPIRGISRLYDQKVSALGLGVFRAAYAIVMLGEVFQLFYFRQLTFSGAEINYGPILLAWMIVLLFLIVGLFTRTVAVINYLLTLSTFSVFVTYEYHHDYALIGINFLLMFMPVSRRFSLDSLVEKLRYARVDSDFTPNQQVGEIYYRLVPLLIIGLTYFDSVFHKFSAPMWTSGLGVWLPGSMPMMTWFFDWTPLFDQELLIRSLGYLTLLFETVFVFLLWFGFARPFLLIVGLGLHLGIGAVFPIPFFGMGFASQYILLVPSSWFSSLGRKIRSGEPRLRVYYDEHCPTCNRIRIIFQHFDIRSALQFEGLRSLPDDDLILEGLRREDLAADFCGVDRNGEVFRGVQTYQRMFSYLIFAAPLSWLMRLPGLRQISAQVYRRFADHRAGGNCDRNECRAPVGSHGVQRSLDSVQGHDPYRRLNLVFLTCLIAFFLGSQCISIIQSPLIQRRAVDWGVATQLGRILPEARAYTDFTTIYFGIHPHGVFLPSHFSGYNHVIALVYDDPEQGEVWLPIITPKGQAGYYNTGRQFVKWSFRVNSPQIVPSRLEDGIRDYTAFWMAKEGISPADASFFVRVKVIDSPRGWEKGFLRRQMEKPWVDAGRAEWRSGRFSAEIVDIEQIAD